MTYADTIRALPLNTVEKGDCTKVLRRWPGEIAHTVVTSPPYWMLRDYKQAGQLGLESSIESFVAGLVDVFREVRRVLRDDGSVWLNIGDTYISRGGGRQGHSGKHGGDHTATPRAKALKVKDKALIPHRVALALQADGWWVRQDVVWHKPNPVPEATRDRPATDHEYVFLLTKSARYYYDAEAVRQRTTGGAHSRGNGGAGAKVAVLDEPLAGGIRRPHYNVDFNAAVTGVLSSRNLRSVWTIPPRPYAGAHFATFPLELVKPCVLAGTSERGCCAACGAPWLRVTKPTAAAAARLGKSWHDHREDGVVGQRGIPGAVGDLRVTTGWKASCRCKADVVPCLVVDPFAGSGTSLVVAALERRNGLGIDLAGGDFDYGGHTPNDRIMAAVRGQPLDEYLGGQVTVDDIIGRQRDLDLGKAEGAPQDALLQPDAAV